jgi:hypothetical protein
MHISIMKRSIFDFLALFSVQYSHSFYLPSCPCPTTDGKYRSTSHRVIKQKTLNVISVARILKKGERHCYSKIQHSWSSQISETISCVKANLFPNRLSLQTNSLSIVIVSTDIKYTHTKTCHLF